MTGRECREFLQWALPRLRLRWAGFRKVQGQVCKRLARRLAALGLENPAAYRSYLASHPAEWEALEHLSRVTISRFGRDRGVFEALSNVVLPRLARMALREGSGIVSAWSAGCASGEEPYGLQAFWRLRVLPALGEDVRLRVLATDIDPRLLERARQGRYPASSLKDLPEDIRWQAFTPLAGGEFLLREEFRRDVVFLRQDIRRERPEGRFHLLLVRNLVFTYFEEGLQREMLDVLTEKLLPGGYLVVGTHEKLPDGAEFSPASPAVFRKGDEKNGGR
jgi:chemotaxis protein methyltransferase CheR